MDFTIIFLEKSTLLLFSTFWDLHIATTWTVVKHKLHGFYTITISKVIFPLFKFRAREEIHLKIDIKGKNQGRRLQDG